MSFVSRLDARATPLVIAVVAGMVSLGIAIFQLSQPHVLTGVLGYNEGYDDGVYMAVATRLVHGVLPYRDFVFVQPPGIAYLMSPIALLGRAIGSQDSLVITRCVTVAVLAVNAVLAGYLVRSVGRTAVFVASFSLAIWPLTVAVDMVELEPFLVFFCLLGAILVFQDGALAASRRLVLGGLAFGFAFDVKVWAILPIAAVLLCCAPRWRRGVLPVALGITAGIVVPCVPFLLAAPHAFVHDVIVSQLSRQPSILVGATPFGSRLLLMFGLFGFSIVTVSGAVAVVILFAFLALIIMVFALSYRNVKRVEWFVLAASAAIFVGMFENSQLALHYGYFPAAFFAPLLGICIGRTIRWVIGLIGNHVPGRMRGRRSIGALAGVASVVVALVLVGVLVSQDLSFGRRYLGEASDDGPALAAVIPPGACVLTDYPADLLVGGRFTPAHSGCPAVIDPFGMYLSDDNGNQPYPLTPSAHFAPGFVEEWFTWLQEADYVVFRGPFSDFIPWSYFDINWFMHNYRLVAHMRFVYPNGFFDSQKDMYVYQRITS